LEEEDEEQAASIDAEGAEKLSVQKSPVQPAVPAAVPTARAQNADSDSISLDPSFLSAPAGYSSSVQSTQQARSGAGDTGIGPAMPKASARSAAASSVGGASSLAAGGLQAVLNSTRGPFVQRPASARTLLQQIETARRNMLDVRASDMSQSSVSTSANATGLTGDNEGRHRTGSITRPRASSAEPRSTHESDTQNVDRASKQPRQSSWLMAFQAMADLLPTCIVISDMTLPDSPIIYANQCFLNETGYTREEIIGSNCRFLQGPATDRESVRRIREALDSAQELHVELINYRKDGSVFRNLLSLKPVFADPVISTETHGEGARNEALLPLSDEIEAGTELRNGVDASSMPPKTASISGAIGSNSVLGPVQPEKNIAEIETTPLDISRMNKSAKTAIDTEGESERPKPFLRYFIGVQYIINEETSATTRILQHRAFLKILPSHVSL
jgi:PAS domain S-box-containing protein